MESWTWLMKNHYNSNGNFLLIIITIDDDFTCEYSSGVTVELHDSMPNSWRIWTRNCSWLTFRIRLGHQRVIRQPNSHSALPLPVMLNFLFSSVVAESDAALELVARRMSSMLVVEMVMQLSMLCVYMLQSDSHHMYLSSLYIWCNVKYHCLPAWHKPYTPLQRCQNGASSLGGTRIYISSSRGPFK